MVRDRKHILNCSHCGMVFFATRKDAKCCSSKCRSAFARELKARTGTTLRHMTENEREMIEEIRVISASAYYYLCEVLRMYGADAAGLAVMAAYNAASDCMAQREKQALR